MFRLGRISAASAYNGGVSARRHPAGEDGPMAVDDLPHAIPEGSSSQGLPAEDPTPADPDPEVDEEAAARRAEDHALIRRAQAGDERAFADLVERHRARAWRVARGLVGSEEDAQDLVQEAFLRVFRSLASFDFSHGFTTWLYRIVTNLAIDHLRKRRAAISTTAGSDEEADIDLADRKSTRLNSSHVEISYAVF